MIDPTPARLAGRVPGLGVGAGARDGTAVARAGKDAQE
jgi:hypothetical protein